jgi:predicted MPP superfamily phosphohydrolase
LKEQDTIKIAHISDLHIGQGSGLDSIFGRSINVDLRNKILQDLLSAKPDLLFLTGDIANFDAYLDANQEKLEELKMFLRDIKSGLADIKIYTVPGNHDFLFDSDNHQSLYTLDRYYGNEDDIEITISRILEESSHESGIGPFSKYLEVLSPEPGECNHCNNLSDFYTVEVKGIRLGIITLNNSWLSVPKNDDTNNLYLGRSITKRIYDRIEAADTDFNVMLIHHPELYNNFREFIDFHEIEHGENGEEKPIKRFGNYYRIKNHSTYIFCGHTHIQGKKNFQSSILSREPIACECGALHFNVPMGYLQCHFNMLHLKTNSSGLGSAIWEQFEYSLENFLLQEEKFNLIENLGRRFPDRLKPLYLLKVNVFYPALLPRLLDEIQAEGFDFQSDILHNIIDFHYENFILKENFLKDTSIAIGELEIQYDDFHKNRSCLVERYFSEIYYGIEGEPDYYFDELERYKTLLNVSGMDLFWKIIHHLKTKNLTPFSFFEEGKPNIEIKIRVSDYDKHNDSPIDNRHVHLINNKAEFESFAITCSSNFNLDINFEYE